METTVINHDIGRSVLGYVVNAAFDAESQQKIHELQQRVGHQFGEVVWSAPVESLHITLMDWLAPLVDYGHDKKQLFDELFERYDEVLTEILSRQKSIEVTFDTLTVTPGAIILIGHDNGAFEQIRQRFVERVDLLPGTKQPPQIIHSSIIRFRKEQDIQPITDFIGQEETSFNYTISSFRLVKETVLPQLEFETLKTYYL